MEAIKPIHLTKRYGNFVAVNALNLTIWQGELFTLLGINGAGKTTTIKMLSGLTNPTSGDAFLMGHSIRRQTQQVKALLGISPQETAVAPNLSVRENLALMGGLHALSKEACTKKVSDLTAQFSFSDILSQKAGTLSGGWQRRLSIAMALMGEPKILFLDEPTLGLDVLARSELWDAIRALKGSTTVILTTHYMEEAEALSDRIGIMSRGNLIALGTPEELKARANANRLEDAFVTMIKETEK